MEMMKAAVFEKEGILCLKEVPVPEMTRNDQVLVKVDAVSICGTDVHITAVPPGYVATPDTILGHELVGTVVKKGDAVAHLESGDRVVVNPNDYCGVCVYCRKNLPNECQNIIPLGIDYDGAFAKYCLVSAKVAYKISKDVPAEVASCTEPLACAINGIRKAHVMPGESVVVIGGGPIGLMIAMLMQASGAGKIFLLETAPYRIEFAKKLAIATVIDPKNENAKEIIYRETEIGSDYVFDVTGSQLTLSVDIVRKGGKVVLFGVNKKSVSQITQSEITTKEISVLGTWLANATFPEAVRILEQKTIDISKLITDVLPLEKIHDGLAKLARGEAIKVIIKP